jgi:hypothetical protein
MRLKPSRIIEIRPSSRIKLALNTAFASSYLLLLARLALALSEGPSDVATIRHSSTSVILLKRLSGILIEPFHAVIFPPSPDGWPGYYAWTILLAIAGYGLFHYGIFMGIPEEGTVTNKVLRLCRAAFFFIGTLLILLVVLRMGVELYYDVTMGGSRGGVVFIDSRR